MHRSIPPRSRSRVVGAGHLSALGAVERAPDARARFEDDGAGPSVERALRLGAGEASDALGAGAVDVEACGAGAAAGAGLSPFRLKVRLYDAAMRELRTFAICALSEFERVGGHAPPRAAALRRSPCLGEQLDAP